MAIYQLFVKLLDGRTRCLQFSAPTISGESLKEHLFAKTGIPRPFQRLITGCRVISDETLISASADGLFPSCALLLRLPGGKGGFGSLLRGAATKSGQKKTNNFDACRDMSGRRLRHVNAEKRLEEWKSEAEDRRLEKLAEQFLKKKAKENKKNSWVDVNKYLEKYREDSEKCMEEVEDSVRSSFEIYKDLKRKVCPGVDKSSKRLKIWLGKNKVDESCSEDDDDDSDDDTEEKSVVLDDGNCSRYIEIKGSSPMVVGPSIGSVGETSGGTSEDSNFGQVNGSMIDEGSSSTSSEQSSLGELNEHVEILVPAVDQSCHMKESNFDSVSPSIIDTMVLESIVLDNAFSDVMKLPEKDELRTDLHSRIESDLCHEKVVQGTNNSILEEPLDFQKYNSAAELEILGMDRLKMELQARGLKCGGVLSERASRLYMLKSAPLDKLPKKFLARPTK